MAVDSPHALVVGSSVFVFLICVSIVLQGCSNESPSALRMGGACEDWCESDREFVENGQRHEEWHCHGSMTNQCGGCSYCGTAGACEDLNRDCAYWAQHGECQAYKAYMSANCCASCSLANDNPTTPPPSPRNRDNNCGGDLDNRCASWAQDGFCQSNPTMMGQHCCGSCGFGGQANIPVDGGHCKEISVEADKNRALNIVLVPSGFNGNAALWREKALWITDVWSEYTPTDAANIPGLNIWYVDVEMPGVQECYFAGQCNDGCNCCKQREDLRCPGGYQLVQHAKNHCGTGFYMTTLIIHNSIRVAGYFMMEVNAAVVTVNDYEPRAAAHEIGHALYGLGDEYNAFSTSDNSPNCDVAGCPKWKDLIGHWGVTCKPNKCKGGQYYAAADSAMYQVDLPFGEANERIVCCKYLALQISEPRFCEKFSQQGLNLHNYCAGNVWKGMLTRLDQVTSVASVASVKSFTERVSADQQGIGYVYVENPVEWTVWKPALGEDWVCTRSPNQLQPGVYLKRSVMGDAAIMDDPEHVRGNPKDTSSHPTVIVSVIRDQGLVREMVFFERRVVSMLGRQDIRDASNEEEISEPLSSISIVLKDGEICDPHTSAGTLVNSAPLSFMGSPSLQSRILLSSIATSFWISGRM